MKQTSHAPAADPQAVDWNDTTLEPLPWFPFTVAASVGHGVAAAPLALVVERAYWALVRTWDTHPRLTLFLLDAGDWQRHLPGRPGAAVQRVGMDAWAVPLDADPLAFEREFVELIAPLFRTEADPARRAA
jgi:hypothetical protein